MILRVYAKYLRENLTRKPLIGTRRADAVLERREQVIWIYVSVLQRQTCKCRLKLTADAGSKCQILAGAFEVPIGANVEVTSSTSGVSC